MKSLKLCIKLNEIRKKEKIEGTKLFIVLHLVLIVTNKIYPETFDILHLFDRKNIFSKIKLAQYSFTHLKITYESTSIDKHVCV